MRPVMRVATHPPGAVDSLSTLPWPPLVWQAVRALWTASRKRAEEAVQAVEEPVAKRAAVEEGPLMVKCFRCPRMFERGKGSVEDPDNACGQCPHFAQLGGGGVADGTVAE